MPPPTRRGASPLSKKGGKKDASKQKQQQGTGVSGTDASLQEWGALMSKKPRDTGDGSQQNTGGGGKQSNNFVSLLDANALKSMKGKGKGKGKGGLLGAGGGAEEANEKACAICAVTEGSVYPPYPRCEISMNALAAIAHYHLNKPKKKETKGKRSASSKSKAAKKAADDAKSPRKNSPNRAASSPAASSRQQPNMDDSIMAASTTTADNNNQSVSFRGGDDSTTNSKNLDGSLTMESSVAAIPPKDEKAEAEDKKKAEEAAARSSTAHVMYCLTCRCLYEEERLHSWMPHRYCERCLYCTHGYRDVRVLDLSPGAATVCKDGLHVPQTYLEVRAQADTGVHWVMPLSESDVLLGRPNLLPPEARDFKSAMNRATKKETEENLNGTLNQSMMSDQTKDNNNNNNNQNQQQQQEVKEFVYEEALETAVCDIVVSAEDTRRRSLARVCDRNWIADMIQTTDEAGEKFLAIAARYYSSQIYLLHDKCKQETRRLRNAWLEEIKNAKKEVNEQVDIFFAEIAKERDESFQEIWMQVGSSRKEMMKKFQSKELFELYHQEALARTQLLKEEEDRLYIFWLTTMNLPNFVHDSIQFQKEAVEDCQEKQKDIWKEMNMARVEVGSEKLFDEFGFRQIVTYGTVSRLRLQVEAEGDKIYERDVKEKAARVDLRYYFLRGKLQAIEAEKRRSYSTQRMNFLHMMLTVEENEARQATAQRLMREYSQILTALRKQAKSEGLFPTLKQQKMDEVGLAMSPLKSASLFDKKGQLIIPNIPYKKPPNPVPASATFINDVALGLTRAFSDPDDVFITSDGRIGLKATPESEAGAVLARDRVSASFYPAESRSGSNRKNSISVGKTAANTRPIPHSATYFDPNDPPPPELDPAKIRENAANQIKKQRGRRRGGGKTANYDAEAVVKDIPLMMSALEFFGEVGTSIGQLRHQNIVLPSSMTTSPNALNKKGGRVKAALNLITTGPGVKKRAASSGNASPKEGSASPVDKGDLAGSMNNSFGKSVLARSNNNNNKDEKSPKDSGDILQKNESDASMEGSFNSGVKKQQSDGPFVLDDSKEENQDDKKKETDHNVNDDDNNQQNQQKNKESAPRSATSSPELAAQQQQQQQISSSSFTSPRANAMNASSFRRNKEDSGLFSNNASLAATNNNMSMSFNPGATTTISSLLPHQRLDFVDRSILSSNVVGRPTSTLFDDEANCLYFLNSIRREEMASQKSVTETEELMHQAMERICVPPPPRHKRERKPAWVEQRAADIFKAANIPPLPPPPPPPPKPKPKPKGAASSTRRTGSPKAGDDQHHQSESARAGSESGRKRRVKFTDAEGESLEFPEGDEPSAGNKSVRPKPKRAGGAAATTDPALMAAMSASQSQREMMRAMSMQAAAENGEDAEGAAFALGHHDGGGGGDGAGSAFSVLLASALDGSVNKKGGGKKPGKKKAGRHYDYM